MSESRGRPFAPGNTLGRGRPKGSRNKSKSEVQSLLDQYAPQLMRTCIGLAAKGNATALRLCMEQLFPARREASVLVRLPRIKTFRDLDKAAERVMQDVGRGKLTPTDGERMVNILEGRARILDSVDNASRIDQLERDWAAAQKRRLAA
jgi:hypothetical protein